VHAVTEERNDRRATGIEREHTSDDPGDSADDEQPRACTGKLRVSGETDAQAERDNHQARQDESRDLHQMLRRRSARSELADVLAGVTVFGAKAPDVDERRHPQHGGRDAGGVQQPPNCSLHDPSRLLYCGEMLKSFVSQR